MILKFGRENGACLSCYLKNRRVIYLVVSFVLLLSVTAPYGSQPAHAAQTGIGSRIVKITAGVNRLLALKADGTY